MSAGPSGQQGGQGATEEGEMMQDLVGRHIDCWNAKLT
jgi:hypothetical protein